MKITIAKLVIIAAFLSCGEVKKKKTPSMDRVQIEAYQKELISKIKVEDGWIGKDCDGLLWNSIALAGGVDLDIESAEFEPGKWHRRAKKDGACWLPDREKNESGSTTSNDMMTGLLLAIWHRLDTDMALRFYNYGKANDWVMGEPYPKAIAKVVLRPNGQYLIARILEQLNGDTKPELLLPNIYLPVSKDFERHLMTIGIYLSGEVDGSINKQMLKRLRELAGDFPKDALFQAMLGLYTGGEPTDIAIKLISNKDYEVPSYVRGDEQYPNIHMLFITKILLESLD
jgi:hypothetical protein